MQHFESEDVRKLNEQPAIQITDKKIVHNINPRLTQPGNKSLGRIDYLVNHCDYFITKVNE
jgi:hypothetical protein